MQRPRLESDNMSRTGSFDKQVNWQREDRDRRDKEERRRDEEERRRDKEERRRDEEDRRRDRERKERDKSYDDEYAGRYNDDRYRKRDPNYDDRRDDRYRRDDRRDRDESPRTRYRNEDYSTGSRDDDYTSTPLRGRDGPSDREGSRGVERDRVRQKDQEREDGEREFPQNSFSSRSPPSGGVLKAKPSERRRASAAQFGEVDEMQLPQRTGPPDRTQSNQSHDSFGRSSFDDDDSRHDSAMLPAAGSLPAPGK